MILNKSFALVIFCTVWFKRTSGTSYSNVFVQSNANPVPVEYVNYGTPTVQVANPQLARLAAAPAGSVVPLPQVSSFTPCVPPCVLPLPSQAVVQPGNARILAYKAPKTPVIIQQPKDDSTSYEYAYAVYDENTGDQKAQRELSDGVVVRGEYSLIQPDGIVREVKYTADDIKGFQAVVKNFLPEELKKSTKDPCPEVKHEALNESREETSSSESHSNEKHSREETLKKIKTARHKAIPKVETSKHEIIPKSKGQKSAKISITSGSHESGPKSGETKSHEESGSIEVTEPHGFSSEAHGTEPNKDKKKVLPHGHSQETSAEHAKHPGLGVQRKEVKHDLEYQFDERDVLASQKIALYGDILKCIQAAVKARTNGEQGGSPLTYILLPYTKC